MLGGAWGYDDDTVMFEEMGTIVRKNGGAALSVALRMALILEQEGPITGTTEREHCCGACRDFDV